MQKLRLLATSAIFALVLTTAAAVPANANYYLWLDKDGCDTTITNGLSFGRTSALSGDCRVRHIRLLVQYPGTAAYWTAFTEGESQLLTQYRPSSSCYVVKSWHSILNWSFSKNLQT